MYIIILTLRSCILFLLQDAASQTIKLRGVTLVVSIFDTLLGAAGAGKGVLVSLRSGIDFQDFYHAV